MNYPEYATTRPSSFFMRNVAASALLALATCVFAAPACRADLANEFFEYFEARNKMAMSGLDRADSTAPILACEHPSCIVTVPCPVCKFGKATITEPDLGQFEGRLLKRGRAEKIDCPLCDAKGKWKRYWDVEELVRIASIAREKFEHIHTSQDDGQVGYAFVPRNILDNMNKEEQARVDVKYGQPCKVCKWTGIVTCAKCKGVGIVDCKEKGCTLGWISFVGKDKNKSAALANVKRAARRSAGHGESNTGVICCPTCDGVAKVFCPECSGMCAKPCKKCNGLGYIKKDKKRK